MFRVGSGEFFVVVLVAMLFLGPEQIKGLIKRWQETLKVVKHTTQEFIEEPEQARHD